ncbi:MAG: cytochrome c-type biogenesis CcmF C-terminal domain-containing protein, partial [Pseudomonadota bacterium]
WFWDPVENASLLPWLAGTALLHSAIVVEKRETLKVWTILLAILAFSLSLVGTFIVRSGLLTSVHAFALDPERGLFILGILIVTIGGSLTLFAWRAPSFSHGRVFAPISRESALILNNLLLTVSCAAVLLGTLYPLFVEALTGNMLSVGPPYFNLTFGPLMLPLLIAMPFGPILAWKRGDLGGVMQRLALAGGLALAGALIVYVLTADGPVLAVIGIGLGIWLVVGAATEIALRIKLFQGPWQTSLARAKGLARSVYGTMLAHAGVGILVLGITGITAWRSESFTVMQLGETKPIGPYTISFDTMEQSDRDNFRAEVGSFTVMREGREVGRLDSEKRFYWTVRQPTTEVGLHKTVWGDLYVVLGDSQPDRADAFVVRAYYNPLANWIWVGSFIMAIGGVLSLTDRRLRVGAPAKRRRAAPAQPAEVPAE